MLGLSAKPIRYVTGSSNGRQVSLFSQDPDLTAYLLDALSHQHCC